MTEALQVGQFCCLSSHDLHRALTLPIWPKPAAETWHKVVSHEAYMVQALPRAKECKLKGLGRGMHT